MNKIFVYGILRDCYDYTPATLNGYKKFYRTHATIVEDIEICVVMIEPWNKPLYTSMSDKHGVKTEKFYLRNGRNRYIVEWM